MDLIGFEWEWQKEGMILKRQDYIIRLTVFFRIWTNGEYETEA